MHQNQQLTQYNRASSAFFSIIGSYRSIFDQLIFRMGPRQHFFLSPVSYRPKFDQLTFSLFFRELRQHSFLPPAHTGQNLISWPPHCSETSASTFVNRLIGHKFWSCEDFLVVFISKDISTDLFFHEVEFWIYFISSFFIFNDWWSVFNHFHW